MTLMIILAVPLTLRAQDYKIPVENVKDGKVTFQDFMGDLPIEGYSGTDIVISPTSGDFKPGPEELERSKGLKPVYSMGTDNTGIGLHVEKTGNQVTIQCLIPFTRHAEYWSRYPIIFQSRRKAGAKGRTISP